jgi:hypothetical protein
MKIKEPLSAQNNKKCPDKYLCLKQKTREFREIDRIRNNRKEEMYKRGSRRMKKKKKNQSMKCQTGACIRFLEGSCVLQLLFSKL